MENYCKKQVEMFLFNAWKERLQEDGMFEEWENTKDWKITEANAEEFVEAVGLEMHMTDEDIKEILSNRPDQVDEKGNLALSFDDIIPEMVYLLTFVRKIPMGELYSDDHQFELPVDRIMRFLSMIKRDISLRIDLKNADGWSSLIEENYLKEIAYTETQLNQRSVFKTNANVINRLGFKATSKVLVESKIDKKNQQAHGR